MITPVKQHPLMEVVARKLSGIESVPRTAQARMVSEACHAARKWHEAEIERLREENGQLKDDKDQMEIGNVALMQRVAELEAENERQKWYVNHITEYRNAAAELLEYIFPMPNTPCGDDDAIAAPRYAIQEIERLRARVAELETEKKTCRWHITNEDEYPGLYTTECGHLWEFIEGGITDNNAVYCQYCGGEIVEARP